MCFITEALPLQTELSYSINFLWYSLSNLAEVLCRKQCAVSSSTGPSRLYALPSWLETVLVFCCCYQSPVRVKKWENWHRDITNLSTRVVQNVFLVQLDQTVPLEVSLTRRMEIETCSYTHCDCFLFFYDNVCKGSTVFTFQWHKGALPSMQ